MSLPTELLQLLESLPEPRIVVDTTYRILAAKRPATAIKLGFASR